MKFLASLLAFFYYSTLTFAHGEDRLGPHGGYVRMPGAFHTEVLIRGKTLYIYLLDLEWKNPITQDSDVQVRLKTGPENIAIVCSSQLDHFTCEWPKNKATNQGHLSVYGKRGSYPPGTSEYDLPLQLYKKSEPTSKKSSEHSKMHP